MFKIINESIKMMNYIGYVALEKSGKRKITTKFLFQVRK